MSEYLRTFCAHCKDYTIHFKTEGEADTNCMRCQSYAYEEHRRSGLEKAKYLVHELALDEAEIISLMGFLHDHLEYKRKIQDIVWGDN